MSLDKVDDRSFNPHRKPLLSCAECRRLKLKCSRVWPCTSCQKRGLSNLCPSGALTTRPRVKPNPAVPAHVLEHIQSLQARINQLEHTLADEQGNATPLSQASSQGEHQMPYLQKKLMRKMAMERAKNGDIDSVGKLLSASSSETSSEVEEAGISLGTLKISADGRSVFFGPTAVTEGLHLEDGIEQVAPEEPRVQPVEIVALAETFPFASSSALVTALQERAKTHLPSLARARELCASYFCSASFVMDPVPEDEWFESLFQRLYGARRNEAITSAPSSPEEHILQQLHLVLNDELSLFFCILALGALTDLSSEPFSAEAEFYYSICKSLMTTEAVLTEPTLCSIQTLSLASYYEGLQSQRNSSRNCWNFMMLANKTAHIMGLHRDHSMVGLDDREMQKRRVVFWEAHSMDMIQSLALGRPICTPPHYMDTCMPIDRHARADATGQAEESFYRWKYRFSAQVLTLICDHVLRVKTPNYAATLETDRRISQFTSTFGKTHRTAHGLNPHYAAQVQMMLGTRETCIMYIHRGFFAQAISMDPREPENGKYSRSVLRTFEGACVIIRGMQNFVSSHAGFAARIWFLWNHLLTAMFVMASVAIRAPKSSLYATALRNLEVAEHILKQTATFGGRPKFMLPILQSLRQKALATRSSIEGGYPLEQPAENMANQLPEENDELAVIGGKTRVLLSRQSSSVSPDARSVSSTNPGATPPPFHLQSINQQVLNVTPPPLDVKFVPPKDARLNDSTRPAQTEPQLAVTNSQQTSQRSTTAAYPDGYHYSTVTATAINEQGHTVYAPFHYQSNREQGETSHYSTPNNHYTHGHETAAMYPEQTPMVQDQINYSQSNYGTTPHPTALLADGSSYLWHAMLQDLGINQM